MDIAVKILNQNGRAKVLSALYGASKPQGLGMLHFVPGGLSDDEARGLMETDGRFDYLRGRVMKVDLSGPSRVEPDGKLWMEFDSWGYDRDNGDGAALRALLAAGLEAKPMAPAPAAKP